MSPRGVQCQDGLTNRQMQSNSDSSYIMHCTNAQLSTSNVTPTSITSHTRRLTKKQFGFLKSYNPRLEETCEEHDTAVYVYLFPNISIHVSFHDYRG